MINEKVMHFLSDNRSLLMSNNKENFKQLFKNTYSWSIEDIDHEEFNNEDIGQLIEIFTKDLHIKTNDIRMEAIIELILELIPEIDFPNTNLKFWLKKWVGLNTLGFPVKVIGDFLSHNEDFLKIATIAQYDLEWKIGKRI